MKEDSARHEGQWQSHAVAPPKEDAASFKCNMINIVHISVTLGQILHVGL
jgi:hypothetical protein